MRRSSLVVKFKMANIHLYFLICSFSLVISGPISKIFPPAHHVQNTKENLAKIKSGIYRENIEELSGQFEGDIILNEGQWNAIFSPSGRNGLVDEKYRWIDGIVPFQMSENHTAEQQDYIEKALIEIELLSCIRFVERTDEEDYIQITAEPGGCYSNVGRQGGVQGLNLAPFPVGSGCFRRGTIQHEFLHALGFFHSQSSTDRDEHVKIEWKHIIEGLDYNFNKYNSSFVTDFGTGYDYGSILHYSAYAFTKNGYATIIPNNITLINRIGQRARLSDFDLLKLNLMYNCDDVEK